MPQLDRRLAALEDDPFFSGGGRPKVVTVAGGLGPEVSGQALVGGVRLARAAGEAEHAWRARIMAAAADAGARMVVIGRLLDDDEAS